VDFWSSFPRTAGRLSLRADFSRDHPHIQPWLGPEGRVVPCLVDGPVDEFVAAQGHYRLIDQAVKWLRSASEKRLIDPAQGWEPMRRDDCDDLLIADAAQLRGLVTDKGGFKFLRSAYIWRRTAPDGPISYFGEAGELTNLKLATLESEPDESGWGVGVGIVLAVWAGRAPSGGPVVCDRYTPENVRDLSGLLARATDLRMRDFLDGGLNLLNHRGRIEGTPETFPVPVVLLVRRPVRLIGSNSNIELCSYVLPFTPGAAKGANPPVAPLGHAEAISPTLLRRLSGEPEGRPWVLLGCGSLGSKLAMHRARSGAAPAICADKATLKAYNVARHALYPRKRLMQGGWAGDKASALATAIEGLGQISQVVAGDQRALLSVMRAELPAADPFLVNTTASTVVREDLASSGERPIVVEACLFDAAKLGYLSVEGQASNPDTAELFGELYEAARVAPAIGAHLFRAEAGISAVAIGQGCSSVTMVASDAQISAMAAPMAELLGSLKGAADQGRIDLLSRAGLSLTHQAIAVAPYRRVPLEGLDGWTVSVSERAFQAITNEIGDHPKIETGGVLIGWISMISQRLYVTSVMEAPADSVRSAAKFELGTDGLRERLERLWEETSGTLVCVGTWHSHLGAATPSKLDKTSAAVVGLFEARPMAFLIHGADGLRAVAAVTPAAMIAGKKS
jgi:hypothetical protein